MQEKKQKRENKRPKKKSRFSSIQEKYNEQQKLEKEKIKAEPNKFKRFWKWIWFWITFPWKWIWTNIRDWRTAVIFAIVFLLVSSEVWVPYLLGFITYGTDFSTVMFSVGSGAWLFWLGPGTPFMVICIGVTIGVKEIFNRVEKNKNERRRKSKEIPCSNSGTEERSKESD